MRKQYLYATIAVLMMILNAQRAHAQSDTPKIEAGVHFSMLRLSEIEDTTPGFGGRITYNFTDYLGLDGEVNHYSQQVVGSRSRTLGLFGFKAGQRFDKIGVFAKARPGFLYLNKAEVICTPGGPTIPVCEFESDTKFALDLGGVLEVYPSRRTIIRFDLGDTIIRFKRGFVTPVPQFRDVTTHNLQLNVGVGLRF
jgi:hypothetical protein